MPPGAGVSFLLTPIHPMQDFFPSRISSRSARDTGGRGQGRQGLPHCASMAASLVCPSPSHFSTVFHWVAGHLDGLECLSWTVFLLIIPSVQTFEPILLCSEPRPSMGFSSYEVFGTIFSMCFLFSILFWGETNLGSYTGQANTLLLCHTPVRLLLFPL